MYYAIGDVHGCINALKDILYQIDKDIEQSPYSLPHNIVFLGDYIDRGEHSKDVMDLLCQLKDNDKKKHLFLRGNHEQMLLNSLDEIDSTLNEQTWFFNGGFQTVQSYGQDYYALYEIRQLKDFQRHIQFIRETKFYHRVGDLLFVHAGIDPHKAFGDQGPDDFLWIRESFIEHKRGFRGLKIIHGHTPHENYPKFEFDRLNLDTAAVFGNKLSCGLLTESGDLVKVLQSKGDDYV